MNRTRHILLSMINFSVTRGSNRHCSTRTKHPAWLIRQERWLNSHPGGGQWASLSLINEGGGNGEGVPSLSARSAEAKGQAEL